jgi:hypothetical protein
VARGDVYYPLHCYSLSHLVPSLLTSGSDMSFIPHLADLANSQLRLIIYFIIGGSVTALTTYFASVGKGLLSAFIVTLPLLTALTFILIDAEGGKDVVLNYARGLLIFTPPWVCYVIVVMLGVQRFGIFKAVGLGIAVYVMLSYLIKSL